MSLGDPQFLPGSSASAAYESEFGNLLIRLPDNDQNLIKAKDIRDPLWTLYNQILNVASQSGSFSQAITYTTATPSSVTIGGITEGMTFSEATLQTLFDTMLHPFIAPVLQFGISTGQQQFGNSSAISLSYYIDHGSSTISTITFNGPTVGAIPPALPSPTDPTSDHRTGIIPTYTTSPVLSQELVFTMSVTTADTNIYTATASMTYKHKRYYGAIIDTPAALSALSDAALSTKIKNLDYKELSTNLYFSQYIDFANEYFVFAVPTTMGEPPLQGFFMDFLFSTDYTKIKSGFTFTNEYGYTTPYDLWISNFKLNQNPVLVSIQNPELFSNTYELPTDIYYLTGPQGATGVDGSDGSPVPNQRVAWGTGTGVTGSEYFTFDETSYNLLSSTGSSFSNATSSVILGGSFHNIKNSSNSIILGGSNLILDGEDDTVYINKLKIATASNDDNLTNVLVRDVDGNIKYRNIDTISSTDASYNVVFSSTDNSVIDRFIETASGIPSNIVGHVAPINSTIDYVTYAIGTTGSTSSADIYINGTYSFGLTMSYTNRITYIGITQSVSLLDEISVYINGSVSQPVVNIHMKG